MGINDTSLLTKDDKKFIELDDFSKRGYTIIRHIAELMAYPNNTLKDNKAYPYNVPSIYSTTCECIKKGVLSYQEYVNEHFDLSNRLEELLLIGINKKAEEINKYLYEEEKTADYVLALDILTDYKYDLTNKAIKMYPILTDYIKK